MTVRSGQRRAILAMALGIACFSSFQLYAKPVDVPITPPAGSKIRPTVLPAYAQMPGRMVDIGGYRLNLYCVGKGGPTVVLEAGGGWGAVAWTGIQRKLADRAKVRVCSYDRAGMNFSDPGPVVRKPGDDVTDLHALLKAARVGAPYVLVGWSAGGVIARRYAYQYPDQVAGLITVDGSTYDFAEVKRTALNPQVRETLTKCLHAAQNGSFDTDTALFDRCAPIVNPLNFVPAMQKQLARYTRDPATYERTLASFERVEATGKELREMRKSYGALPLRVIVAGNHFGDPTTDDAPLSEADFVRHSYQIATLSTNAQMIVIPEMTHAAQLERPAEILPIIADLVAKIREQGQR
jgi:pimeloyl-ACP methyl ester carboxylesterase